LRIGQAKKNANLRETEKDKNSRSQKCGQYGNQSGKDGSLSRKGDGQDGLSARENEGLSRKGGGQIRNLVHVGAPRSP
jgi:hypothetical protein